MKILVTTPTGNVGRHVVRELLAPEFTVRVIARDPARLPEEVRAQAEVVCGSTDDAALLETALDGMDALFWCTPPPVPQETEVRGHYERFARAAAAAVRQAGTPHVVTVSSGGRGLARNAGPMSALHAMEDIFDASGAAVRHLRCGAFMENFLRQVPGIAWRGVITQPMPGHIAIPMVAAADVADVALRWLVRREWTGRAGVAVHGPEDLSYNHAAALLEQVLGRPVRYEEISANAYAQLLVSAGVSAAQVQGLVAMFAELANGIARVEPRTSDTTTATSFTAWATRELLPRVLAAAPGGQETNGHALCKV